MSETISPLTNEIDYESAMSWQSALSFFLAAILGATLALIILPRWLPLLFSDIITQKAYWHLARSSGIVAYLLLWLSTGLGVLLSNRMARTWPGSLIAFDIHQFTSLLAIAFTSFHVLILLGDDYIGYTIPQLLIPFATTEYKPIATGLGQIAFYLTIAIIASFYLRQRLGSRAWRTIHYASFLVYLLITLHGIIAGSDTPSLWLFYLFSVSSIMFLTIYRILITHTHTTRRAR